MELVSVLNFKDRVTNGELEIRAVACCVVLGGDVVLEGVIGVRGANCCSSVVG